MAADQGSFEVVSSAPTTRLRSLAGHHSPSATPVQPLLFRHLHGQQLKVSFFRRMKFVLGLRNGALL